MILYMAGLPGNTVEQIKAEFSVSDYKCLDIFFLQMNAWKYNKLYFNVPLLPNLLHLGSLKVLFTCLCIPASGTWLPMCPLPGMISSLT